MSNRLEALACCLLFLVCALLTTPFVESGVGDDFGYIRSAQLLAQTGHIHYNGTTPMLGWQLYLGAAFIKLYGFSFTSPRMAILLLSVVSTYLLHRVLVQFGLGRFYAALGALTVMLSPVWLVLTVTFMTDAAGLFCLLLCIYGCQKAVLAGDDRAAASWLWFAGLSDIAGGTARQIAWLGVLAMVPSTAWLLRKRKGLLLHGAVLWAIAVVAVVLCMHWFLQQPYVEPESFLHGSMGRGLLLSVARTWLRIIPSLGLFALPVMVLFTSGWRDLPRRLRNRTVACTLFACGLGLAVTFVLLRRGVAPERFLPPWLGYDVTIYGVMQTAGGEIAGHNAVVLPPVCQIVLLLCVLVCGICVAAQFFVGVAEQRTFLNEVAGATRTLGTLNWRETLFVLGPFAAAYATLLVPRATESVAYDRYLMPLVLIVIVVFLRYAQERLSHPAYVAAGTTLVLYTCFAVAGTHDRFAFDRARLRAANEVTNSGVRRTEIEGGFEYDGWTEIVAEGYVDDPRMLHGTYHPTGRGEPLPCHSFFFPLVPAVQPKYQLSFKPSGCFSASSYPPVTYNSWLPPHRRTIYIQQLY